MQKLTVRQRLLLGFTLFSMFFGAGNLIFPPHLGAQAGSNFWPAFAGFAVSAIGLPIAGVVAVARAGGFDQLASRVHPKFSLVFTILIYLSIGPCLAIPRTASTSFEMLVPLVGGGRGLQLGYSTVFFAAAFLAGLNFGAVLALNIQALGVTEENAIRQNTIQASFLAGGLLLVIYAMLGHVGALTGAAAPDCTTGAEVLSALASALFGRAGQLLLAAIFLIACFNTCVGLISCVGQYFHTLLPRIPYPALAGFFAAASMFISNIGLAGIIRLSTPVLGALYPAAIVLIALSFLPKAFQKRSVYVCTVTLTAVQSVLAALPFTAAFVTALPLGAYGFGWVVPAAAGLLAVFLFP